jgi:hypothetical protein
VPHNIFVGRVAEGYDEGAQDMYEPAVLDPAVDFLTEAARGGTALEFGIGTGRVALPLSRRGNAAAHLAAGGRFVIELWLPDLRRFPPGALALPFAVGDSHLGFDEIDVATQQGVSRHYFIAGDRVVRFDSPWRYTWPAELDLMARIAGLTLRERWADWDGSPFTSESTKHISVWEPAG